MARAALKKNGKNAFDVAPKTKVFRDYRVMLDTMGSEIDAVVVATGNSMCMVNN